MNPAFIQVIVAMLAGIVLIIILSARLRVAVFFALLLACLVTGLGVGLSLPQILETTQTGFGKIMRSLGFIIVLGTTLGLLLEQTGCARVMANFILEKLGKKNSPLALSITGFIVGLPVFCDSGFIVLSGLNRSLIRKTGFSAITMSVSLASGLYAVHCLLPPHPGAASAAGTIGVDFGRLLLYGIIVAIPVMLAGHFWSKYAAGKFKTDTGSQEEAEEDVPELPSTLRAFLPVIVPIVLIAARSLLLNKVPGDSWWQNLLALGDPVIALSIAVLFAIGSQKNPGLAWGKLVQDALEKAGTILLITGAGGAFGAILAATNIGDRLETMQGFEKIGLLFPFLAAFILKTAQGSSTVAIITASVIVLPLLPALGLQSANGKLLAVLSMGAGSMMISHANDSYFWVIARFSGIDMKAMLRGFSLATIFMGLTGLAVVFLLSFVLL